MSWKSKVPGGFGTADVKFAGHPLDMEWAEDAISDAKESGATFDDMANEICWASILALHNTISIGRSIVPETCGNKPPL
ncbi:hypothetical protein [Escherichia coli]|uniref:hypothetical protein n=1 Tax=Escherichia coli TaxID=562 RepID=UPI000B50B92F|nr:hypothetical protein [Escherichia coli]RIW40453.1 hypothetical protein D3C97_00875 [Escherichia coli]